MKSGLPVGHVLGQEPPMSSTLEDVENRIEHASPINGRTPAFTGFREHGMNEFPLGVAEIGVVIGVFHRPKSGFAE